MDKKTKQSKSQIGTMTATSDANADYSNSSMQSQATGSQNMGSNKQQASKKKYGTLTAENDANNDY